MNFYRTGLILVLSAGVGMITITPVPIGAQDRGAQNQRQQGGQKPAANASKPARPQQSHTQRPQAARPSNNTRPTTQPARPNHNTRPTTQPARPSHNTRPSPQPGRPGNNGRPTTQPNRPGNGRPQTRPNRGSQGRPNYQFRSQDSGRLRQYYQGGFGRIDRRHRPRFSRGGYIPRMYWGDFQPVPYSLIGYLPAVPPGYAIGYYDGYVVVYDPVTYVIVSVLDILQ
jgi:hypothetical protein